MLSEPKHRKVVINGREKLWFHSMKSKGRWKIEGDCVSSDMLTDR